jgi:hypothetical protein
MAAPIQQAKSYSNLAIGFLRVCITLKLRFCVSERLQFIWFIDSIQSQHSVDLFLLNIILFFLSHFEYCQQPQYIVG